MSSIAGSRENRSDWSDVAIGANAQPVPIIVSELAQRFNSLRLRYARWLMAIAIASVLSAVGCMWTLLAIGDYWLELPGWLRQASAISVVSLAAVSTVWALWLVSQRSSARQFAIGMECRFESMGQRLRTVLELERGKVRAPEVMLTALGHQTMARWETSQPTQILPYRALVLSLIGLVSTLLLLLLCAGNGAEMRTALLRAAGWNQPYTTLHVSPGDIQVLEGLQPEVQLELHGRPHRHVVLRYRALSQPDALAKDGANADIEWIESTLKAQDVENNRDRLRFVSKLDKLSSDMQYQFDTDVGVSPIYAIKMRPKIVLVESSVSVRPPAYTQLPERSFGIDEVTVLAGSTVTVSLKCSRPLKNVSLKIGANAQQLVEAEAAPEGDGAIWKFSLPTDRALQWQFTGNGQDDAPLPVVSGKLRIRQDQQPRLDWQSPADELAVNMLAEVPMSVLISDDYGLTHAGIVFQLGDSEEFVLAEWTGNSSEDANQSGIRSPITTRLRLDEILPLESFALSERDFVSYYAFADDNREASFQHAESEVRYLDIRPLKQFFSEVETPPGAGGGRSFPMLNELISRERYLYNRTRGVSRHYDATNKDQLRTLERMVETQSEIANFTRYLIDFLASQGNDDNEALGQAESVMLQASDALATADFPTAILRELDAIRLLVEAKNSVEIAISKNNNPSARLQLNNFQRQMVSRLRRKIKPADTKIADDIKQIAAEQQRLGTRVADWLREKSTSVAPASNAANVNSSDLKSPASTSSETSIEKSTEKLPEKSNVDELADGQTQASLPSIEEQLKAGQQELLDRLTTLNSDLSEKVKQSPLATERLAADLLRMDGLTGKSTQGDWADFAPSAMVLASDLMELGEQLKALAQNDPAQRIASLRDLTAALASEETEFANRMDLLSQPDAAAAGSEKINDHMASRAKWIVNRTQTLEDVIQLRLDSGDLRTSEIVDQLEKLIVQQEFRERLQASAQASRQYAESSRDENWSSLMRDRARDHAHTAELFDQLQKQLVAPRVALLRRLESKASQLAQAISSNMSNATTGASVAAPMPNSGGGGQGKITKEDERGVRDLQTQLQAELQNAGLSELAELLDAQNGQGSQAAGDKPGAGGGDLGTSGRASAGANQAGYNRMVSGHRNAIMVQQKLQTLLQELILLETTIDRSAPVPAQYKQLVDAYYKSLADGQ